MNTLRISPTVVAVVLLGLIALQIVTNIRIAAEESAEQLLDRAPFFGALAMVALLVVWQPMAMIRWKTLLASGLFFAHVMAVMALTTEIPLRSFVLPNYGIVSWMLLGMASNGAILTIERRIGRADARSYWQLASWLPTLALASLLWAISEFALNPTRLNSYQFPAANSIVLLLFGLLALDRWTAAAGRRNGLASSLPALTFLALGTVVTYVISRMNSTAIVAVWSALALALIVRFAILGGWKATSLFVAGMVAVVLLVPTSPFVADFFAETRFRELREGADILAMDSLASRLDLLPSFDRQFSVSPWFGHMEAEVAAGMGRGEYVHSMPLSALTHTGLIGAALLLASILLAAGVGRRSFHGAFPLLLFAVILVCASAFAFFTWIPLWFMIGYLTIRTNFKGER